MCRRHTDLAFLLANNQDLKLTPSEWMVLMFMADQAKEATSKCWPSLETLSDKTGLSVGYVSKAIKRLTKLNIIKKEKRYHGSTIYTVFDYSEHKDWLEQEFAKEGRSQLAKFTNLQNLQTCKKYKSNLQNLQVVVVKCAKRNHPINHPINHPNIYSPSLPENGESQAQEPKGKNRIPAGQLKIIATDVLSYLNSKTGSSFQATRPNGDYTGNTQKIKSVLKAGYTQADMISVIDKKYEEWKDTDFVRYLRPDTLFRLSKFEQYLDSTKVSGKYAGIDDDIF